MDKKDFFELVLKVLCDYRVIVTTVAMILVVLFIKYITDYKKKAKKKKNLSSLTKNNSKNQSQNQSELPHSDLSEEDSV